MVIPGFVECGAQAGYVRKDEIVAVRPHGALPGYSGHGTAEVCLRGQGWVETDRLFRDMLEELQNTERMAAP